MPRMYRLPVELRERLADVALEKRVTAEGLLREIVGVALGIPAMPARQRWLTDDERRKNHSTRQMDYARKRNAEDRAHRRCTCGHIARNHAPAEPTLRLRKTGEVYAVASTPLQCETKRCKCLAFKRAAQAA